VHRIGRTGRANRTGEAITFVTMAEEYHVRKIEAIIKMAIPRQPLPAGTDITETPFDEKQAMLREVDSQRKKEDPTFKGAFHEKKNVPTAQKAGSKGKARPGSPAAGPPSSRPGGRGGNRKPAGPRGRR